MIFYFSASGNSQAAAEQLAAGLGERLISIGLALRDMRYAYDLWEDKYLGFVLPTFAYTLPGAVARFIERLELRGYAGQYTFGVFTCGASSGDEGAALEQALAAKGLGYNGSFDVVMPDNFILWTPLPPEERLAAIRAAARERVDGIPRRRERAHRGPPAQIALHAAADHQHRRGDKQALRHGQVHRLRRLRQRLPHVLRAAGGPRPRLGGGMHHVPGLPAPLPPGRRGIRGPDRREKALSESGRAAPAEKRILRGFPL